MNKISGIWTRINKPLVLLNMIFIVIYTILLDRYPIIWVDDNWFSNPAYNLANGNGMGTTLLQGFIGIDEITFWQPPVHFLLLAAMFKILGTGLIQGRMVSVIIALIGVNTFYFLAREFVSNKNACLSTIMFGLVPIYFIAARQIRMEILYCVFSMLSFYFLVRQYKRQRDGYKQVVFSGIFSSLALLSHPNGLVGIIANIACIALFDVKLTLKGIFSKELLVALKGSMKKIAVYLLALVIVAVPYVIFILLNFNLFYQQFMFNVVPSVHSPLDNLLGEYMRYVGFFFAFTPKSLPFVFRAVMVIVVIGICALGVITVLVRSYDDDFVKMELVYMVVSALVLCIVVSHKYH
nr:glycosyltransferase family 39 protein [Candidatus Sigynarchaeota archaeon]